MSYQKVELPNIEDDETGIKLDTNDYVAAKVTMDRDKVNSLIRVVAYGRQVDSSGDDVLDNDDKQIKTAYSISGLTHDTIDDMGGRSEVGKTALKTMLGEPDAYRDVPDNIRYTIEAADMEGNIDI